MEDERYEAEIEQLIGDNLQGFGEIDEEIQRHLIEMDYSRFTEVCCIVNFEGMRCSCQDTAMYSLGYRM